MNNNLKTKVSTDTVQWYLYKAPKEKTNIKAIKIRMSNGERAH